MTNQITVLTDLTDRDWLARQYEAVENLAIEDSKQRAAPKQLRVIHEVNARYYLGRARQAREAIIALAQSRIGEAA
jgi:hypothetical protein|tara:strand:- start:534 stop:761 length:228 start_codon:yes stop_codon:yes gene_type:complete